MTINDELRAMRKLQKGLEVAIRVETELHYQAKESDLMDATRELVEAYRLTNNALAEVLALIDKANGRSNESPARMFGGDPFPPILTAKDVHTTITEALDS